MLLTKPEELKRILPTHDYDNIEDLYSYFADSENEFVMEKLGRPLLKKLNEFYAAMDNPAEELGPLQTDLHTPWHTLISMVQRAIAFDSFYNMAEINALIFNQGGIHRLTSDQMEKADKDTIATFKKTCYQHAHTAINRMLVQLEEWAQSLNPATTPDETENTPEEDLTDEEIKAAADEQAIADIVALWKVSRYYYLANGLFINTATKFNEYVDIYANREKFVSLQPDLRHCQEMIIRAELGEQLYSYLMDISVNHTPTAEQAETLRQIQFTLALFVESRNKMFKRPEAKDEAYLHLASAKEYILAHAASLNEKAVKASPFYKAPAEAASEAAPSATAEQPRKKRLRRGFMLVMPKVKN